MKLSTHFSRDEFDCHDGQQVPDIYLNNLQNLVDWVLQPLRDRCGPLAVISGYRSPEYNKRVGGAGASNHMTAMAADVRPMSMGVADLHSLVLQLRARGDLAGLGGLGLYPTWIHLDILQARDGHLRRWTGGGIGSEQ